VMRDGDGGFVDDEVTFLFPFLVAFVVRCRSSFKDVSLWDFG